MINMFLVIKFECWYVDILGFIIKIDFGFQYIFFCVDVYICWIEVFFFRIMDLREIVGIVYNQIFCRYGSFRIFVFDRG